jgi:SNF family Na+-dependent transporter
MKNIRKFNFKKSLALAIILVIFFIVSPFISNDYSFMFLKTMKYWVSMVPMLLIIPFFIYIIIEEDKNLSCK